MGKTTNERMQDAMDDYNRKVRAAMYGDVEAAAYLIDCDRGDSTADTPTRWKTFREWAAWNRDKGANIRRMIQQAEQADRRKP